MDENTGIIKKMSVPELEKAIGMRIVSSDDMLKAMQAQGKIPVKRMPNPKCKRCYGVGNLGRNVETNKYVACPCVL